MNHRMKVMLFGHISRTIVHISFIVRNYTVMVSQVPHADFLYYWYSYKDTIQTFITWAATMTIAIFSSQLFLICYTSHTVGRIGSETLDFGRCIIACFNTFILIYFDFVNRYALCNWWIRTWPTSRCRRPADIIANGKRVTRHSNGFSCKQKRYRRYSAFFSWYNSGLKKQFPVVFSVIMLNQIS